MTCNRSTSADTWNALGDCADLNGDAGQQWVALYACRNNEVMQPILADSLKAVRESSIIPAGYTTGIHMFGSDSIFNMNNKTYDWNQSAPGVFVYFQIDEEAPVKAGTSGSAFTAGWIALAAAAGMAVGAAGSVLFRETAGKKKETAAGS